MHSKAYLNQSWSTFPVDSPKSAAGIAEPWVGGCLTSSPIQASLFVCPQAQAKQSEKGLLLQHTVAADTLKQVLMHRGTSPDGELIQRERLLWERQETLWQQQLSHWQHERNIWAQREATLMAHIQQLHAQITTASTQQMDSAAQTSRQPPSSAELISQGAEAALLEPRSAPQLTALAPNTANAQRQPPEPTTSQSLTSPSATSQQQPESQSSIPTGPPPCLCIGSDDIYWVNQLQTSLTNQGYYCGEEETEDFVFGQDTESAVMTFQVKDHPAV